MSGTARVIPSIKPTTKAAGSAPVEIENTDGVLTIKVNHGDANYAVPQRAGKDGKVWTGPRGLVAEVGSRFGAFHIGDGVYVTLYVGRGDEPQASASGNITVKR